MFKIFSFNYKNITPLQQGVFTLLLITLISVCCLIIGKKDIQAWDMILSPIFLFSCYNPIIGAFQQKLLQYIIPSVVIFILLAMYIYISGNFVSTLSYKHTFELHWITALVGVFYFLLNILCLLFRGILSLLEEIDQ